jgi:hypothetical protein
MMMWIRCLDAFPEVSSGSMNLFSPWMTCYRVFEIISVQLLPYLSFVNYRIGRLSLTKSLTIEGGR